MKGLNVKKLAAVAAGAALVGSALLPIVTAAASDLTKTDIYSDGTPAVNIVVGASAAVSDVVWAGNIAAAVARNAVTTTDTTGTPTPSSCAGAGSWGAPSDLKAKLVVGGTTTITGGARELITALVNNKVNTAEYQESVGNAYFTSFKNGSLTAKKGTDTNSVTETETIGIKIDAGWDTTHTDVKDLVAVINNGDLNYVADFGSGVVPCAYTDSGSADYVPINFLGKPYVIDSVNSDCTQVELVTNTAETIMAVGDMVDVTGRTAGTAYKFKIIGGSTKSDGSYQAQIELQDANGTKLQSQQFTASTTSDVTFYDGAGNNLIETRVTLKSIAKQSVASSDVWSFTLLVGSDRITVKNGQRFPYDPNNTTGTYPWTGTITLGNSSTMVAKLIVKNQAKVWDATNPLYSSTYSLKSTGNSKAVILEGSGLDTLGEVEFKGFYDSGVQKTSVKFLSSGADVTGQATPYGNLDYYDASSVHHQIPYAMKLSSVGYGSGTFVFEGQTYNFRAGITPAPGTAESSISSGDGNFWFKTGSTIGSGTSQNGSDSNYTVDGNSGNNEWGNPGDIDANVGIQPAGVSGLKSLYTGTYSPVLTLTGRNSKTYNYALKATASGLWLVLTGYYDSNNAAPYTGKIDDLQWNAGTIWLLGTDYDDINGVATRASDTNLYQAIVNSTTKLQNSDTLQGRAGSGSVLPYYAPDTVEFGANPGSTTGIFKTAVFKIKPIAIGTTMPDYSADAQRGSTVYVDTADHKIVDTANINKTNYTGKLTGIDYNSDIGATRDYNINNLSEYTGSSSTYTQAFDANGVLYKLASRELTVTVPNAAMKAYVVVKSNDVTSSVTGETLEIAKGESKTTTGGTKIDVTDLTYTSGSCGGDSNAAAVSCSAVTSSRVASGYGSLVVTDTSAGTGRHIIVGGWKVNRLAKDLDLESELTAAGDAVVDVTADGDVVVAGYTASDTGNAAKELIAALDAGLE